MHFLVFIVRTLFLHFENLNCAFLQKITIQRPDDGDLPLSGQWDVFYKTFLACNDGFVKFGLILARSLKELERERDRESV